MGIVELHLCIFVQSTIELHLSELFDGQRVYIIGVPVTKAHQLSALSIIFLSHGRSLRSDGGIEAVKIQLMEH